MQELFKKIDNGSIEDYSITIKENIEKAQLIRKEILDIKKANEEALQFANEESSKSIVEEYPELIEEENTVEEEENYYIEELNKIKYSPQNQSEIKENVLSIIPSPDNSNFETIINRLIIEVFKRIVEIKNFILVEKEEIDAISLQELFDEVSFYEELINTLKYFKIADTEELIASKPKNTVVFLKNYNGNTCAYSDFNAIPKEQYDEFINLIDSIIDGSFKDVKHFNHSNNELYGVSEVRSKGKRVMFDRVGKNQYLIIDIFLKKQDNDKKYQGQRRNRVRMYHNQEESIKQLLNSPDYIAEQKEIYEDLIDTYKTKEEEEICKK